MPCSSLILVFTCLISVGVGHVRWLPVRSATRPALRLSMSEDGQQRDEPGPQRSPLDVIADASWDLFVMPGEHANSRYDRPLEQLSTLPYDGASPKANSTFQWGGVTEEQEALRLPSGLRAAERLAPMPVERPRGLWFEVDGRGVKGDVNALSRQWSRLWALAVVIVVLVNISSILPDMGGGGLGGVADDASLRAALHTAQRLRGGALSPFATTAQAVVTRHATSRSRVRLTAPDSEDRSSDEGPPSDEKQSPGVSGPAGVPQPSDGSDESLEQRLNALLDRQVFDPDRQARTDEPFFLGQFRQRFDADPEAATILYVGGYFALLLCFAQQGVRIYKHCYFTPDKMCPWEVLPSVDELLNF